MFCWTLNWNLNNVNLTLEWYFPFKILISKSYKLAYHFLVSVTTLRTIRFFTNRIKWNWITLYEYHFLFWITVNFEKIAKKIYFQQMLLDLLFCYSTNYMKVIVTNITSHWMSKLKWHLCLAWIRIIRQVCNKRTYIECNMR